MKIRTKYLEISILLLSIALFLLCGKAMLEAYGNVRENKTPKYITKSSKGTISPKFPLPVKDNQSIFEVKGTYYQPTVNQCDRTPFETADGSIIRRELLKFNKIKWVALSRDMLERWGGPFGYGDTLYVFHHNNMVRGEWIVHDSMNARFRKRIDFLRSRKGNFPGVANNILISNKPFYNER